MSKTLLEIAQAIQPNVRGTSRAPSRRQLTTLNDARAKTVDKVRDSIAFVSNGMKSADGKPIDTVFTEVAGGTFQVGAKYGNRWLPNLVAANEARFEDVEKSNLVGMLTAIAEYVEAGNADEDLIAIRTANANRKRRSAA